MASTTRQSTAAARRKAATAKAAAPGAFEPVRIDADSDEPEERVPLFYIGDDEYTIPKTIPRGVALQYLRHASEVGHEVATAPLLIRVLGEDAYMALEQSRAMTSEQLERIVDIIIKQALGEQEKGGKAQRG
ncbi:hypothetical protein ACWERY_16285 [Streptomyces sp. NPDC004082]